MSDDMTSQEQRRGARIPSRIFVRVLGVDERVVLRTGNLSVSGVYVDCDIDVGEPGSVERIELKSADGGLSVVTPAVVVRVQRVKDLWAGERIEGVAFQFLPDDADIRARLKSLVEHVADIKLKAPEGRIALGAVSTSVEVIGSDERAAAIGELGASGLTLVTDWPIDKGAAVALTVVEGSNSHTTRVFGHVERTEVVREGKSFRVHVGLDKSLGLTSDGNVPAFLNAILTPEPSPLGKRSKTGSALLGSLSRVPLTSVMSFIEWEQWTGALVLVSAGATARVFVVDGRPYDAKLAPYESPAEVLAHILRWREGSFSLERTDVPVIEDRLQTTFRALLIDFARVDDESITARSSSDE